MVTLDSKEFDLVVDLISAMLNKALENRARNKGAIDEYYAARREGREPDLEMARKKKPRKVPEYHKKYAKNFNKAMKKHKKKNGSWKKDGFKKTQKEAHRMTKKEMKR